MDPNKFGEFFSQLFTQLNTQDSVIILIFLFVAFLLGWLFGRLSLSRKLRKLRKSLQSKETDLITTKANYESLNDKFNEKEAILLKAEQDLEQSKTNIQELELAKSQLNASLYTEKANTDKANQEIAKLQNELQKAQTVSIPPRTTTLSENGEINDRFAKLEKENQALHTLNEQLEAELQQLRLQLGLPEVAINTSTDQPIITASENTDRLGAIETKLARLEAENTQLKQLLDQIAEVEELPTEITTVVEEEVAPSTLSAKLAVQDLLGKRLPTALATNKDDLQKINGIGPFIEEKLNDIGIYTYEQISLFDQEISDLVTDAIQFFPGRILRDDWQGQAQQLMSAQN